MSVTLAKITDHNPSLLPGTAPFTSRQWQNTVRLAYSLYARFGDDLGVSLYEGLSDNDLTTLRDVFPQGYTNYPTALPKSEHVTDYNGPFGDDVGHITLNYADGYGGTYSRGE